MYINITSHNRIYLGDENNKSQTPQTERGKRSESYYPHSQPNITVKYAKYMEIPSAKWQAFGTQHLINSTKARISPLGVNHPDLTSEASRPTA